MKAQQGSQFMAGGTLQSQIRPSGAADPINIGPGLLQSLQSLTQTQNLAPQQVLPIFSLSVFPHCLWMMCKITMKCNLVRRCPMTDRHAATVSKTNSKHTSLLAMKCSRRSRCSLMRGCHSSSDLLKIICHAGIPSAAASASAAAAAALCASAAAAATRAAPAAATAAAAPAAAAAAAATASGHAAHGVFPPPLPPAFPAERHAAVHAPGAPSAAVSPLAVPLHTLSDLVAGRFAHMP